MTESHRKGEGFLKVRRLLEKECEADGLANITCEKIADVVGIKKIDRSRTRSTPDRVGDYPPGGEKSLCVEPPTNRTRTGNGGKSTGRKPDENRKWRKFNRK